MKNLEQFSTLENNELNNVVGGKSMAYRLGKATGKVAQLATGALLASWALRVL